MAKCSTTGVSWPVVMMAISVTTVSARFNVSFTMAQRVKARLHDATFVQNIIGSLLKNGLDQTLYRVDARKTLLDDPQQNLSLSKEDEACRYFLGKSKYVVWRFPIRVQLRIM